MQKTGWRPSGPADFFTSNIASCFKTDSSVGSRGGIGWVTVYEGGAWSWLVVSGVKADANWLFRILDLIAGSETVWSWWVRSRTKYLFRHLTEVYCQNSLALFLYFQLTFLHDSPSPSLFDGLGGLIPYLLMVCSCFLFLNCFQVRFFLFTS